MIPWKIKLSMMGREGEGGRKNSLGPNTRVLQMVHDARDRYELIVDILITISRKPDQ